MGSPELVTAGFALNKAWLDPKNLKLSGSRNEHLRVLIRMLENRQGLSRSVAQCLLGKPVPVSDPVGSMRSLVAEIHAESPKDAEEIILAVLARMVNYWNFANDTQSRNSSNQASGVQVSSLPQPEIPVRMPRPEPPFTPRRWAGLKKYKDWSDAVLVDIESSAPKAWSRDPRNLDADARRENISYRIARVLASAVLWGGLLCREHLEAFYLSLSMWPNTSEFIAGRVYLTWVDEINNCRRWLPDPITTSVLMQLRPAELKEVAQVTAGTPIERILSKYFEVAMADSRCAFHLSEFIDASLLHYELRLPRCLTEYAAGRLPSASPNRATWTRMTRGHTAEIENESADSDENHSEIDDEDEPSATLDEGPGDWVSRLRLLLGSRRKKLTPSRALSELQRHLANSQSGMQEKLFLDFAVDMLRAHHRDKLRSIRSLVLGVATRLPVALDLNNPGSIAPDRLSNAYSFLLDDATSPSQYNKLRRYLREFHHWLERTKQCEGIDEPDIFGSAKQAQAVDARLILEDEYVAVRDSLVDSSTSFDESLSGDKELRLIAGLVLILGFRGGLRRDEALKAQLDAALLDSPAEFLVRPWSERKLKTPNAVRKLPLEALLDPYELALLRAWVQRRQGQNSRSAPSPFLFFASQLPEHLCVPEGRIFPVIHEELRRVTGDERCHFHTARKSGAGTFLAFTLLRPPGVPLPGWLDQWPKQRLRLENAAEIHRKLYRNDFATRRHLFAVAKTLGHSSPGVSCANYLELQGDLLALWLDTERPFLSTNQFRMLTEKSVGTAHGSKHDLYQGVWAQIERKFSSLNLTCIGRKQQG